MGDEQVIDVELDRRTVFVPVQDTLNSVPWNGDGDYIRNDVVHNHLSSTQPASTADRSSASGWQPRAFIAQTLILHFRTRLYQAFEEHCSSVSYDLARQVASFNFSCDSSHSF